MEVLAEWDSYLSSCNIRFEISLMKITHLVALSLTLALGLVETHAQTANTTAGQAVTTTAVKAPTPYQIVETGANHRVWQRETYEQGPNGKTVTKIHKYTEVASGMNYQDGTGKWIPAQETIGTTSSGAVATQGQYQVIFANNLNSSGSISMLTSDGKRLISNILGLAYYDSSTGNSAVIAQIQDSQGELLGNNQVLYPNAFAGVNADVRYTYKKGSFEQDVILREQLPTPESFGLNAATTVLEVMTEFLNPPQAIIKQGRPQADGEADENVSWGAMEIVRGKAFELGAPIGDHLRAFVIKNYKNINGRRILFEKVRLTDIQRAMSALPLQSSVGSKLPLFAGKQLVLPKPPKAQYQAHPIKLAKSPPSTKGFVLDYITVSSSYGFTFQGDTTYFVNGYFVVDGTTTFEGGTVVKYSDDSSVNPSLDFYGNWVCPTGPYQVAMFTSMDDNSIGEQISGSTGSPAPITNSYYFWLDSYTNFTVSNLRLCYAQYGLEPDEGGPVEVRDCQFVDCLDPVDNWLMTDVNLHNVLFAGCRSAVACDGGATGSLNAENITADVVNLMDTNTGPAVSINLTNCIVFSSTGGLWAPTVNSVTSAINPPGMVFQTLGAGSYYLATNSAYRNAGTTNISAATLADLSVRTTYPPIVYPNATLSADLCLSPQAQRDNDTPDLGYHYDPLDYVFGGSDLFAKLNFSPGTAVGWYEDYGGASSSGQPYAISLNDGANIVFNGTVTAPCWFAHNALVMEGNGNWTTHGWMSGMMFNGSGSPPIPQINAHFAKFVSVPGLVGPCRDNWAAGIGNINDSEFYNSGMGCMWPSYYYTNCLFVRSSINLFSQVDAESFSFMNCTFYGGCLATCRYSGQSPSFWLAENDSFDGTAFAWSDNYNGDTNHTEFNFNAYNTNNLSWTNYPYPYPPTYGTIETVGPNDLYVTNFDWQPSWFGNFYLPTDSALIDAGSTTADQLGLYHFTTQTSRAIEGPSQVDIGYHYVATDANGNPLDQNGDGIPDYIEDGNGNGLVDSGEIGWNIYGDPGLKVIITRPRNGNVLP